MEFSEGEHEWEEVQTSLKVGVEDGKSNFTSSNDTITIRSTEMFHFHLNPLMILETMFLNAIQTNKKTSKINFQ